MGGRTHSRGAGSMRGEGGGVVMVGTSRRVTGHGNGGSGRVL